MIIFLLIELILGFVIYAKKPGFLPCYWLILSTLALPIVANLGHATSMDDVNATYGIQSRALLLLFGICLLLSYKTTMVTIKKLSLPIFIAFCLVFIRIVWTGYHNSNMSIIDIVYDERYYFFTLIVPVFMYSLKRTTLRQIGITLVVITLVEIIFALLNHYLNFHLYSFHYFTNDIMKDVFTSGTFRRFSVLAAFLGIVQVFVATSFFIKREIKLKTFLFMTISVGIIVAMTGSRTGFYAFLLANILPLLLNYRTNKKYVLGASFLAFLLVAYIFTLSVTLTTKDADNGIDRILYGMVEKTNKKSADYGEGTDNMTYELIGKYATINPLGNGLSANCNPSIAYKMNHVQDDCALAYIIVDKGWLYALFCLLYFICLYKTLTKSLPDKARQSVAVIFFITAIMSVTDEGIFNMVNLTLVFLFAYWCEQDELLFLDKRKGK